MIIEEAKKLYIGYKRLYLKDKSIETYQFLLKSFFDGLEREEVDRVDYDELLFRCKAMYSASRYHITFVMIRDMLDYMVNEGHVSLNLRKYKKAPKYITTPHQYITFSEFRKMLSVCEEVQKKLAISLLWWTGMRVSELCELRYSQFDLTKKETEITCKKSNLKRLITWDDDTHFLLIEYHNQDHESDLMFGVWTRSVERWVKSLSKKAGIQKKISPHSFRHGIAHHLKKIGCDIETIKTYIGHANIASTVQNYMRWDSDEIAQFRADIERKHKIFGLS